MLIAAAVCPCPPLLVPEVAGGAASELDAARAACYDAIGLLAAARPDRLVAVGPAGEARQGSHPEGTAGSFRGFGVDLEVRLGPRCGDTAAAGGPGTGEDGKRDDRELPASLAVAAWLLERTEWSAAPVEGLGVGESLAPGPCAALGREVAEGAERTALLVMGDGTARRWDAPGPFDECATDFDAAVARALSAADTAALAALDASLAHKLKAAGRSSWQVLAGAAEGAGLAGELLFHEAPYGVGYFVAAWSSCAARK